MPVPGRAVYDPDVGTTRRSPPPPEPPTPSRLVCVKPEIFDCA
ncbi:Uncharacterised protein [Mycobacteroides abscessus]|nr:Uncharacterised protein [Mycobacteroides abscessus]